jgi:hypothetical protein
VEQDGKPVGKADYGCFSDINETLTIWFKRFLVVSFSGLLCIKAIKFSMIRLQNLTELLARQ